MDPVHTHTHTKGEKKRFTMRQWQLLLVAQSLIFICFSVVVVVSVFWVRTKHYF
jgi:hypothetical protein